MEGASFYLKVRAKGRAGSIFEIPMESISGGRVVIKMDDDYEIIVFITRQVSKEQEKQAG